MAVIWSLPYELPACNSQEGVDWTLKSSLEWPIINMHVYFCCNNHVLNVVVILLPSPVEMNLIFYLVVNHKPII